MLLDDLLRLRVGDLLAVLGAGDGLFTGLFRGRWGSESIEGLRVNHQLSNRWTVAKVLPGGDVVVSGSPTPSVVANPALEATRLVVPQLDSRLGEVPPIVQDSLPDARFAAGDPLGTLAQPGRQVRPDCVIIEQRQLPVTFHDPPTVHNSTFLFFP